MEAKWRRVCVRDLVAEGVLAIGDGYRMRNLELGRRGVPFVRGGDIGYGWVNHNTIDHIRPEFEDRIVSKLTRPWDVAFITKGTVGRVGLLRPKQPPVVFAPQVAYWRSLDQDRLLPRFIYYLLCGPEFQACLNADKTHGAMAADYVSISQQYNFRLLFPPLAEQRAIVNILGTLDDKIELNRQTNETLEAMARAIFKSWFVDFDPVRAKAEGRRPAGMDADTAKLFPSEFEDSELGEIPKGWTVQSIGDLADVVGGSTPSTKEPAYWIGGTHNWATPKDLSSLSAPVLLDTERRITYAGLALISSGLLPPGTVLMSSRAPIGYLAIAEVPVAINQGFIAMKPRAGVPNVFLLLWALENQDTILSRANGSTFLEISKSNFRPIPTLTPPQDIFAAFGRLAAPLYAHISLHERQSRILAGIRDMLLPKLLSGEISLLGTERAQEALA